ncbi:MAG: Gldg family protein [Myxococcales bacterium]|nr:Gldg family protein [Myxococcales bacterium]
MTTVARVAIVARMQLAAALRSPVAWMVAAGFLVLEGVSFAALVAVLADPARPAPVGAVLEGHFGGTLLSWAVQLTVIAAVAARAAEDRRTGLWEALVAAPIGEGAALVGTWLGALALYVILWLPTVAYVIVLAAWSPGDAAIDWGPVVAGYGGQLVIGAAALAVALAAGATVRQPVVATVAGFAVLLAWLIVGEVPTLWPGLGRDHPALVEALAWAAPRPIAGAWARGAIAPATVAWLGGLTVGALALAAALVGVGRRRRAPLALAAYRAALVVVGAALVAIVLARRAAPWDVSRAGRNHLAAATERALDALDAPVTATVIRPGIATIDPLYDEVERVLALMAHRGGKVEVVRWDPARDPTAAPAAAAAAVLDERELVRGGAVILARGPRTRAVALLDLVEVGRDAIAAPTFTTVAVEQALARALAELADDAPRTLCTTVGHGELDAGAWGAVTARLADDGIAVEPIERVAPVPARCTAVAVIGAATALPADDQRGLDAYLARGGGLLVAVAGRAVDGAAPTTGVDAVLAGWGVAAAPAWVDDPDGAIDLPGAVRVIDGYADHPIVRGFRGRRVTIWQRARALVLSPPAQALVTTSAGARALDERGAEVALAAPLALAATAERARGRVVVLAGAEAIGVDPDVRGHGTDLLAARAAAWLVGRVPEVSVPPKAGDQVRLVLTGGERRAVAGVVIVGIPLIAVALLALLARRRRP